MDNTNRRLRTIGTALSPSMGRRVRVPTDRFKVYDTKFDRVYHLA